MIKRGSAGLKRTQFHFDGLVKTQLSGSFGPVNRLVLAGQAIV